MWEHPNWSGAPGGSGRRRTVLEPAFKSVRRGLEDRRNNVLHIKMGAFPCHMLVREGCLIFRGFGKSGIG